MKRINSSSIEHPTIIRIILWIIWTIWTAFYIYPKYFHEGIKYLTEKIGDWVMQNPDTIILIFWGIYTIVLGLDLALKFGREHDLETEMEKLRDKKEKETIVK